MAALSNADRKRIWRGLMRWRKPIAIISGIVIMALVFVVPALSQGPALPPGEYDLEAGQYVFNVPELAQPTDTPVSPTDTPVPPTDTPIPPSATPVPPSATPVPPSATPSDNAAWHSPTTHEHGDVPPQWVLDSPLQPNFDRGEAHPGNKGFLASPDNFGCCGTAQGLDVQIYFLPHILSTPKARGALFHSYQLWLLDEAGNVSYWQGKLHAQGPINVCPGNGAGIVVVDQAALDGGCHPNEIWYVFSNIGGPDLAWTIERVNYLHDPTDDLDDPATWNPGPSPNLGLGRNIHLVLYKQRILNQGAQFDEVFCVGNQTDSNRLGDIVDCSDPDALPQYVASTTPNGNGSLGKSEWRTRMERYICPDCEVPN